MTIFSAEFWTSLPVAILVTFAIPPLLALMIWSVFFAGHGAKLNATTTALNRVVAAGAAMPECSLTNLDALEAAAAQKTVPELASSFQRMKNQLAHQYTDSLIPESRTFFSTDTLIALPAGRMLLGGLYGSMLTIALISLLAVPSAAFAASGQVVPADLILGALSAALIGLIHLIFIAMDQRAYSKALMALNSFYNTLDTVLPVAGALAGPALLLSATLESRRAFEAATASMTAKMEENSAMMSAKVEDATNRITDQFNDFAQGGVLPALVDAVQTITDRHILPALNDFKTLSDQTMTRVIARQESGMAELATSFAASLSDTLEVRMTALAAALGQINTQMTENTAKSEEQMKAFSLQYTTLIQEIDTGLTRHMTTSEEHALNLMSRISSELGTLTANTGTEFTSIAAALNQQFTGLLETINTQLAANVVQLSDLMTGQRETLEQSSGILIRAAELQGQAAESSQQLNDHVGVMAETMSKFQTQTDHFITEIMDFSVKNSASQLKMSEDINAAQLKLEESLESSMEKYAQMSALISGMMTDITQRMNEAMAGAGREIAAGINQVTAENAVAISELTIQAQKLREDYTSYFERTEDDAKTMMENLDYQMNGLMLTMTEGISTLLKDTVTENANVLSQYKDQTVDLLQSFEEQALSISLYAKEINLDITELTSGIKGAVADFTTSIQEGVKVTISEFDQGLAELTDRIANTVESISEAVESLPTALSRK